MLDLNSNGKSLESQKKIYKSLRRILKYKSLNEITVSDIKNECGISRSTFYRNFDNVVHVLDVMLEFFYNRYLLEKIKHDNQLLFFFEYWYWHRDLIHIIVTQNEVLIRNCLKRHDESLDNPYLIDIKVSLYASLLSSWSKFKKEAPKEMEELTKNMLNRNCIDILLENNEK